MLLTQTLNIVMLTSNHMFITYGWNTFVVHLLTGSFKTTKNKVQPSSTLMHSQTQTHRHTQQAGCTGIIPRPTLLRMCKYDHDLVQSRQRKEIEN